MITDKLFNISVNQALGGTVPFDLSTDHVDLQELNITTGGAPLYFHVKVTEAFTSAGTPQVSFLPVMWPSVFPPSLPNIAFAQILTQTDAFFLADLTLGQDFFIPISGYVTKVMTPYYAPAFVTTWDWRWLNCVFNVGAGILTGRVTITLTDAAALDQRLFPASTSS